MLLVAEGSVEQATAELVPLHEDFSLVYGTDHEETQEIADVISRLHRAGGKTGHLILQRHLASALGVARA